MKRNEFLLASGTLVTAAMLFSLKSKADNPQVYGREDIQKRRPDPDEFTVPIVKALSFGLNAPNPHNTQPWKFKLLGETQALFYVDEKRLLTATDPLTRQIHIGCGSFIALFQIGASSMGYSVKIEYLPEGAYGLAEIGTKPIAKLTLEKPGIERDVLFPQIYTRQTTRSAYHGNIVSTNEFNTIVSLTKPAYSSVELINDPQKLPEVLRLLYKGMEVECYDWNAFDESRKWFRVKEDISAKKDGLNLRVSGIEGKFNLWLTEILLKGYPKKLWHDEGTIQGLLKSHYDKVMSSKGVVIFKTANNQVIDWIQCGQDYARFQLAAYDQGLCMHPLSQVLQEYPSMKTLLTDFNQMMHVQEPAKIQMAVRIGRSKPLEYSYRRNVNELIISA
ncbi:MAG TPA: hypothetical protein VG847_04310 [Chitinophagaceae bacterium]|nr:hypothetical protein [Chitinophagaceae bacterium]